MKHNRKPNKHQTVIHNKESFAHQRDIILETLSKALGENQIRVLFHTTQRKCLLF